MLLFYVANPGRGFVRRNQLDFEIAEKESMIRRSGISLVDTVVAILLLGVWTSITIFFVSGLGPGSRSSALQRDLRTMRSWLERCTRPNDSQPSTDSVETLEGALCRIAGKTNTEGNSDSASDHYRRTPMVNRFG
ncbi:MAG: hypothetical protein ACYS8I_09595, partial [Planctomycetota bacterium]